MNSIQSTILMQKADKTSLFKTSIVIWIFLISWNGKASHKDIFTLSSIISILLKRFWSDKMHTVKESLYYIMVTEYILLSHRSAWMTDSSILCFFHLQQHNAQNHTFFTIYFTNIWKLASTGMSYTIFLVRPSPKLLYKHNNN